jgi:hypothetical protein
MAFNQKFLAARSAMVSRLNHLANRCVSVFLPASRKIQVVPPGHEHVNIGRIKLHSSIVFI